MPWVISHRHWYGRRGANASWFFFAKYAHAKVSTLPKTATAGAYSSHAPSAVQELRAQRRVRSTMMFKIDARQKIDDENTHIL